MGRMLISLSSPSLVEDTDFNLDDGIQNAALLARFRKQKSRAIGTLHLRTQEKLTLLRTGTKSGAIYAEYKDRLVIRIKYEVYKYNFLPAPTITQTVLWKDPQLPITNMFSHDLFFDIMIKQSNAVLADPIAILSDQSHTSHGRDFWMRRTGEALAEGLNVALVDFGKHTYEQVTDPVKLEKMLHESWSQKQSDEARFKQLRWLIWSNKV